MSDPTREATCPCAGRCHHDTHPCSLGCWAAQKPWRAEAALSTTPAPDRETTTTNLARHLHRKGVGCDGHRGNDPSTAHEMHRDDAYDLVDWFASIPPREEPLHDD